jgi:hypothetical protein
VDARIFVFGPHGFGRPLPIEKVSETVFRARVPSNHTAGLFRALQLSNSSAFPQIRLYRHGPEVDDAGPNIPLLQGVSKLTGGRFAPEPSSIFNPDGHTAVKKLQLWPGLVILAVLVFLLDWISVRKREVFDRIKSVLIRTGATPEPRAL